MWELTCIIYSAETDGDALPLPVKTSNRARTAICLLLNRGIIALPHSGTTLGKHLARTYDILKSWQYPEHVALAGLTHAAYGTRSFSLPPGILLTRADLRSVIGSRAERLVYLYSSLKIGYLLEPTSGGESALPFRDTQLDDIVALVAANCVEQQERSKGLTPQLQAMTLSSYLKPRSKVHLERVLGDYR